MRALLTFALACSTLPWARLSLAGPAWHGAPVQGGGEQALLYQDLAALDDGSIVVLCQQPPQLLRFTTADAAPTVLATPGEGPGELPARRLALSADREHVYVHAIAQGLSIAFDAQGFVYTIEHPMPLLQLVSLGEAMLAIPVPAPLAEVAGMLQREHRLLFLQQQIETQQLRRARAGDGIARAQFGNDPACNFQYNSSGVLLRLGAAEAVFVPTWGSRWIERIDASGQTTARTPLPYELLWPIPDEFALLQAPQAHQLVAAAHACVGADGQILLLAAGYRDASGAERSYDLVVTLGPNLETRERHALDAPIQKIAQAWDGSLWGIVPGGMELMRFVAAERGETWK